MARLYEMAFIIPFLYAKWLKKQKKRLFFEKKPIYVMP